MEFEGSLPSSQQPITGPYPKPDASSPDSYHMSLKSILISSHLHQGLLRDPFPSGFSPNFCINISHLPCVLYATLTSSLLELVLLSGTNSYPPLS